MPRTAWTGWSGSMICGFVFRTSAIRLPETAARGYMMKTIDIMTKENSIWVAY